MEATHTITTAQIKAIHTLMPLHIREDKALKESFIASFTGDYHRSSTRQLTYFEAEEIIYFLKTGNRSTWAHYAIFDKHNKQHLYLLSLAHQKGWTQYSDKLHKMVADLESLGSWLRKYGYLHKPLKQYTAGELPKLITQFSKI
jgi:hypothetical protein